MNNNWLHHPTHLFLADRATCAQHIISLLQNFFCTHKLHDKACTTCIACKQIAAREHASVYWFAPERSYGVEDVDDIIALSRFTLDENEYRFFIIEQTECLTDASANRLLKTIEEPAAGYYYFLATNQQESLPATIVSRCLQHKLTSTDVLSAHHALLEPFISLQFNDPIGFIKQLDTNNIKEYETKALTEYLFAHYAQEYKKVIKNNNEAQLPTVSALLMIIDRALDEQPMMGGAKLFWKNIYLQCHYAKKN